MLLSGSKSPFSIALLQQEMLSNQLMLVKLMAGQIFQLLCVTW